MPYHQYFILFLLFILAGCNRQSQYSHKYTIGISYQNLQNEFILNIQDDVREKAKELNVKLIETEGQGKAKYQISQVENFMALDVEAIILNPFDKYGSAPVVSIAKREGKPIVAAGKQDKIAVIGVGAISDALKAVKEGKLCAAVFQDARGQGAMAVDIAIKILERKNKTLELYPVPTCDKREYCKL